MLPFRIRMCGALSPRRRVFLIPGGWLQLYLKVFLEILFLKPTLYALSYVFPSNFPSEVGLQLSNEIRHS
jgi:hypothetical protein